MTRLLQDPLSAIEFAAFTATIVGPVQGGFARMKRVG